MNVLDGDLSGLSFPRDLARLRQEAEAGLARGGSLVPLYSALGEQAPMALLDLVMGPKALSGELAVQSALELAEVLEAIAKPSAVYKRLGRLCPDTRLEVLATAATRHPAATWLVRMAEELGETPPGRLQLEVAREHPGYAKVVQAHGVAGHFEALFEEADEGQAEPAAALLLLGREAEAVEAAARALDAYPQSPVVAYLAAAGGPDMNPLLRGLVPRLRSAAAAHALAAQLAPFPATKALLTMVLPGLR